MNYRLVAKYMGYVSFAVGLSMLPSALWAVYFSEWASLTAFALSVAAACVLGAVLTIFGRSAPERMWQREALTLVSVSWMLAALAGSFPYLFGGHLLPIDAFFESMSGFTTTGSTVIRDIEALPKSILFWRSMTQWLGGVSIVVLFIAVLPHLGAGGKPLFRSETTAPETYGLSLRLRDTTLTLFKIYGGLTVVLTGALMIANLSFYDALCHAMTTLSSGGFSPRQESIGAFNSAAVESIVIVGMLAAGTSFALFFLMLRRDWLAPLRDTEWKVYVSIAGLAAAAIALNLALGSNRGEADSYSIAQSLRASAFQTVSIFTGTGFVTEDLGTGPLFSRMLLFMLMFVGGCAASTTGGVKVFRLIFVAKLAYWRVENTFRPKTIRAVRIGDHIIDDDTRRGVHTFFVIYILWFVLGSLIMAGLGLPFETALSSTAATLNNIGPGLAIVGGAQDYADVPMLGKLFLSLCMVVGRLELFAVTVLFVPSFWKHS